MKDRIHDIFLISETPYLFHDTRPWRMLFSGAWVDQHESSESLVLKVRQRPAEISMVSPELRAALGSSKVAFDVPRFKDESGADLTTPTTNKISFANYLIISWRELSVVSNPPLLDREAPMGHFEKRPSCMVRKGTRNQDRARTALSPGKRINCVFPHFPVVLGRRCLGLPDCLQTAQFLGSVIKEWFSPFPDLRRYDVTEP